MQCSPVHGFCMVRMCCRESKYTRYADNALGVRTLLLQHHDFSLFLLFFHLFAKRNSLSRDQMYDKTIYYCDNTSRSHGCNHGPTMILVRDFNFVLQSCTLGRCVCMYVRLLPFVTVIHLSWFDNGTVS